MKLLKILFATVSLSVILGGWKNVGGGNTGPGGVLADRSAYDDTRPLKGEDLLRLSQTRLQESYGKFPLLAELVSESVLLYKSWYLDPHQFSDFCRHQTVSETSPEAQFCQNDVEVRVHPDFWLSVQANSKMKANLILREVLTGLGNADLNQGLVDQAIQSLLDPAKESSETQSLMRQAGLPIFPTILEYQQIAQNITDFQSDFCNGQTPSSFSSAYSHLQEKMNGKASALVKDLSLDAVGSPTNDCDQRVILCHKTSPQDIHSLVWAGFKKHYDLPANLQSDQMICW